MTFLKKLTASALLCTASASVCAVGLTLDVSGKIAHFTDDGARVYHFGEAELLAMPVHSIRTGTTWTPVSTFCGPLLSDVLARVGAHGTALEFHTLDDYIRTIPLSDTTRYGVVLAYRMNGERLPVNTFGPLFVIYPRDRYPDELNTPSSESKFVWQVRSIVVK